MDSVANFTVEYEFGDLVYIPSYFAALLVVIILMLLLSCLAAMCSWD